MEIFTDLLVNFSLSVIISLLRDLVTGNIQNASGTMKGVKSIRLPCYPYVMRVALQMCCVCARAKCE